MKCKQFVTCPNFNCRKPMPVGKRHHASYTCPFCGTSMIIDNVIQKNAEYEARKRERKEARAKLKQEQSK